MKRISYFKPFIKENNTFSDRLTTATDKNIAANEFQTAFNWIETFGGRDLLRSKNIANGYLLFNSLMSGEISIEEIDDVTRGEHGQVGNIPWSETNIAKNLLIPYLNINKYNI